MTITSISIIPMTKCISPTSAHTPGPWVLRSNGEIQAAASLGKWNDYICKMPFDSLSEGREIGPQQIPNARLIVAAPDLRDASQRLCDAIQDYLMGTSDVELPLELVAAMDAMEATWNKADTGGEE